MRRTIKLTDRQAEMVLAMFVGNQTDAHCTDDEIRELVAWKQVVQPSACS
jgi:hypothetical protein